MLEFLKSAASSKRPQNVVVLDFGSSSTKAAIIDLTTFHPTLLGLGEASYQSSTFLSGLVADLPDFLQTVRNAVRQASFACGFTPHDFVFSLSGEFVKTLTVDLKVHRETSGLIKGPEEGKITKEIARLIDGEVARQFPKITGNPHPDFRIIEKGILNLESAEGIHLESLNALLEQDFKATVLVSFIGAQTEKLLQKISADLKRPVFLKTSQMSNMVSLLKKSSGDFSGILVDFGGQITDVGLVLNGAIMGTRTLPLGGRDVTLEISEKYGMSFADAEEKKERGDFAPEDIKDFLFFWLQSLGEALKVITEGHHFSKVPIFLYGGSGALSGISELVEQYAASTDAAVGRALTFESGFQGISQKALAGSLTLGEQKTQGYEPILAAGGEFLENYGANEF